MGDRAGQARRGKAKGQRAVAFMNPFHGLPDFPGLEKSVFGSASNAW